MQAQEKLEEGQTFMAPLPNILHETAEPARTKSTFVQQRLAGEPRQGNPTNIQASDSEVSLGNKHTSSATKLDQQSSMDTASNEFDTSFDFDDSLTNKTGITNNNNNNNNSVLSGAGNLPSFNSNKPAPTSTLNDNNSYSSSAAAPSFSASNYATGLNGPKKIKGILGGGSSFPDSFSSQSNPSTSMGAGEFESGGIILGGGNKLKLGNVGQNPSALSSINTGASSGMSTYGGANVYSDGIGGNR